MVVSTLLNSKKGYASRTAFLTKNILTLLKTYVFNYMHTPPKTPAIAAIIALINSRYQTKFFLLLSILTIEFIINA